MSRTHTPSYSNENHNKNNLKLSASLLNIRSLTSKANFINHHIVSSDVSFFALTECWLNSDSLTVPALATPDNYVFLHNPRTGRRGGGVGLICKSYLTPSVIQCDDFSSFELLVVNCKSINLIVVPVYRPPNTSINTFLDEFGNLLTCLHRHKCHLIILGDFNIPLNKSSVHSSRFLELIDLFSFTQHVKRPTNLHGNIIDLIISSLYFPSIETYDLSSVVSDHFLIEFDFYIPCKLPPVHARRSVTSRNLSNIDVGNFNNDLCASLSNNFDSSSPDNASSSLNQSITDTLNSHAPLKTKMITLRPNCGWYSRELRSMKRLCRARERRRNKARNSSSFTLLDNAHKLACRNYFNAINEARISHTLNLMKDNKNNLKTIFKIANKFIKPNQEANKTLLTPDEFSEHFLSKIDSIRSSVPSSCEIAEVVPLTPSPILSSFRPTCCEEITKIISSSKKTSSPIDILPSRLYLSSLPAIAPYLTKLINLSLSSGLVPCNYKHVAVKPILKKPNSDINDPSSFRPISLMSFESKVLEKIVASRLNEHLEIHNLHEPLQSGFRKFHSTETALLKVANDLRLDADRGKVSLLVLLDLSAAFDTLDPGILFERLRLFAGLSDSALAWFKSYILDRTFSVYIDESSSHPKGVKFGVPQGSVLGPTLFLIYMLPLGLLLRELGISFHVYADDTQVYISCSPDDIRAAADMLISAYNTLTNWLSNNFLKINPEKTEILLIGTPRNVERSKNILQSIKLNDVIIPFTPSAKNLGVHFDSNLSFSDHIRKIAKTSFSQLKNLKHIRKYFDQQGFEILMHAFISSRLDYCNALYTGIPDYSLRLLQLVQNYAARLILNKGRCDHASPLLRELHWLPVKSRIDYKILLLCFKARNSLTPDYLSHLLEPYIRPCGLRNPPEASLLIPSTRLTSMGDRAFSVFAPKLWNALPFDIKTSDSLVMFRKCLKTHLCRLAFG